MHFTCQRRIFISGCFNFYFLESFLDKLVWTNQRSKLNVSNDFTWDQGNIRATANAWINFA